MESYSVHVAVHTTNPVPDELLDDLAHALEPLAGSVGGTTNSWSATIAVDDPFAEGAAAAAHHGQDIVLKMGEKVGLPIGPVIRLECVEYDELERELAIPNYPDLVSGPEAAEILHVTRQRLHQLAATNADFPTPLYRLGVGSLWTREAIEAFDARWPRKPGRPPVGRVAPKAPSVKAPSVKAPRVKPPTVKPHASRIPGA